MTRHHFGYFASLALAAMLLVSSCAHGAEDPNFDYLSPKAMGVGVSLLMLPVAYRCPAMDYNKSLYVESWGVGSAFIMGCIFKKDPIMGAGLAEFFNLLYYGAYKGLSRAPGWGNELLSATTGNLAYVALKIKF